MKNLIDFTKRTLAEYLNTCEYELISNEVYEKKNFETGVVIETGVAYLLDILDEQNYRTRIPVKVKGQKNLFTQDAIVKGIQVKLIGAYIAFLDKDGIYIKAKGIDQLL